jgi:cyclic pyranopterin phosphate synthase
MRSRSIKPHSPQRVMANTAGSIRSADTVSDRFGRRMRDLRISVTDKCNFRCPYCMPADRYHAEYEFLPKNRLLTFEEITRLARIFVDLGVVKIRLTGGEPLLRKNLPSLVAMLRAIEGVEDIALTTNGVLLPSHAEALADAGLKRITISLDSLDDEAFRRMNGRDVGVRSVLDGVASAQRAGFDPIKINCVVVRGVNDGTVVDLAAYFRGSGCILRFIEYMDVGTCNGWRRDDVVPTRELIEQIHQHLPIVPVESNYRGEVAQRYRYADGAGEIGFISSVTAPFCGDCSRARLSADGRLFTCLFAAQGADLMKPMRSGASDEELRNLITGVWRARTDRYSELRSGMPVSPTAHRKVEMYHIGG